MPRILSYSLLVLAMFLWGSSFVALKFAFAHLDPWLVIWLRLSLAGVFGLVFFRWIGPLPKTRRDWSLVALMALFEPCLYFIFETLALQYTTASQAGTITAILPILVALAAWMVLGERIHRRLAVGSGVAFLGAVWLSLGAAATETAPRPILGNALEVLAMASAAGYVLCVKELTRRLSPWFLVLAQNLAGGLFFFPFALYAGSLNVAPVWSSLEVGLAVLYLSLAVSLGAFLAYQYALKQLPASRAALFTYLIPIFATGLGAFLLGESLSWSQLLAAGLIVGGVAWAQSRAKIALPESTSALAISQVPGTPLQVAGDLAEK
jgi:drug/metabolite transporter (DMT)-like permease